ncbi:hypothetical protein M3Y99_01076400 [Aphelenchoides fujianensis]|nr:hypothetical protein M3Y99_01076400 [Aphelenchoides fujianensis]
MRCSQDGRLLKPLEDWGSDEKIRDLFVVNWTTILVSTSSGEYTSRLHVCRLRVDEGAYEHSLLFTHNCQRFVSFALVEITGREVDVKRAVLGDECALVFLRVDVDEPRATLDHDPYLHHFMNGAFFASHWSADGREVNAIRHYDATVLFTYSMERKKWSQGKLTGSNQRLFNHSCGNSTTIYANTPRKPQDGPARMFRCNLAEKRWEEIPTLLRQSRIYEIDARTF